ncbi:MAG: hypothetical protein F6K30_20220 [Cyanothece sp. SIO2G6]|nr:hypothetical protein [Cyanothece sp. SIO2G6]
MAGLTIWQQRALAGKGEIPQEIGYTKILQLSNDRMNMLSEVIQELISADLFFIYWDDISLSKTFKFVYFIKFQIGKFSGQVLPSPLWSYSLSRFMGAIVSQDEKNKREAHFLRIFRSEIKNVPQILSESVRSFLRFRDISIAVMAFDSFNLWSDEPNGEEILIISQVLGMLRIDRNGCSLLNRHALPANGLTYILSSAISFLLIVIFSTLSKNFFDLSDYLVNEIRLAYGVTDFWGELWTSLIIFRSSGNESIPMVLLLSLVVWVIFDLVGPLLLLFLGVGISLKVVSRLRRSRFSESTCVLESLRILIELEREDALSYPLQKKYLMIRMDYLASMSLLIPNHYPGHRHRKAWVNNQFRSISAFIHDRQSWLYAPGATTLQDLRRDFHMLARMYVDGSYGAFPHSEEFWPKPVPTRKRWLSVIAQGIIFFVPLGLIVLALAFPGRLPTPLQVPEIQQALVWVGIAWLLLGIDKYLNLEVLDSIVDLASGLKGLK